MDSRFVVLALVALSSLFIIGRTIAQEAAAPPAESADDGDLVELIPRATARRILRHHDAMKRVGLAGPGATRGLYSSINVWPPTTKRLNVCFLSGRHDQRMLVVKTASEWKSQQGLPPLNFGDDTANPPTCTGRSKDEHIRIAFEPDGTMWSAVGNDSVTSDEFPLNGPSMNLGWKPSLGDNEKRRAILHEFGHALGLEHEHQNENANCQADLDMAAVKTYYRDKGLTTDQDIQNQIGVLHLDGLIATDYDPQSVMMYSLPAKLFRNKSSPCIVQTKPEISANDRKLVGGLYPAGEANQRRLQQERRQRWQENDRTKGGPMRGIFNLEKEIEKRLPD